MKGGYWPATVHGRVGERLRLIFEREESAACSEHVVFPAFGKSAMLPVDEEVALELLPDRPGEYEFTCSFGLLRGRLIVTGPEDQPSAADGLGAIGPRASARSEAIDTAIVAAVAGLCSGALLLLVTAPFVGWRASGLIVVAWFAVVAATCFVLCVRQMGLPSGLERGPSAR